MKIRSHFKIAFVLSWCAWMVMTVYTNDDMGRLWAPKTAAILVCLGLFGYLAATRKHRE